LVDFRKLRKLACGLCLATWFRFGIKMAYPERRLLAYCFTTCRRSNPYENYITEQPQAGRTRGNTKMPDEPSNELAQRLRKAEEAAAYVERLESLASEAPALREQVSLLHRIEERKHHRRDALERARRALDEANQVQASLPEIISGAANLVNQLAETLRVVDTFRREATAALSVVDRMDYEEELDQIPEPQSQDEDEGFARDSQSSRMIVAARHGSTRVRQMIDHLSPGFEVFAGCNLDAVPMRRELTTMIMAQLAAEAEANRPQQRRPAPPPPPQMSEPSSPVAQELGAAGD
jgi:hypothetical protein